MQLPNQPFKVFYNNLPIYITPGTIGDQASYTVNYGGSPIILKRSTDPEGRSFWASVPDVNIHLVEELGTLIEKHINSE